MPATNYKVDEKDTVQGRLDQHADFNSPVAKRIASFAEREAAAKQLTRSSISVGNALGNMLDQATDVAKTDSTNIISAKSSFANTKLTTDTQERIAKADNKSAGERLAAQLASNERVARTNNSTQRAIASDNNKTQLTVTDKNNDTTKYVNKQNNSTQRQIARDNNQTQLTVTDKNNQNAVDVANINKQTALEVERLRARTVGQQGLAQERNDAWNSYQSALTTIDPNASAESKELLVKEHTDAFSARLDYLDGVELTGIFTDGKSDGFDESEAFRAYTLAKNQGLSAEDIDLQAGIPEGSTAKWLASKGLSGIK